MTRILVVEDSPTQAEILRTVLEGSAFAVDVAADGEKAIELFERETFDLVISDIVMPGMSGYDLCRKVKHSVKGRDIPVILLSSLSDPMDIIRGLECEADSFITKPYQADRLVSRINSILENRKLRGGSGVKFGVELMFLGRKFHITSEKEQILDLLITTFEDTVRTNLGLQKSQSELAAAKIELERYARELEARVRDRTAELERKAEQLNVALEASNRSEARFRGLLSNLTMPILVCDRHTLKILHVSEAAIREYGYRQAEFLAMSMGDLAAVNEAAPFEETSATLLDRTRLRRRHKRSGGEAMDMEVTGTPLDFEGRPAILVVAINITDRLKTEAQLRHNERLDAVGSLTGGVAHDFNNLLTVIKSSGEELCEELGDSPLKPAAELVLEAAGRGAELVRHLMAFARKQELMPTALDVNGLVDAVMKLIRRTLPSNIEIKAVRAANVPVINIDAGRLENALLNLAVNARDAMPQGGQILIETSVMELDEQYAQENAGVRPGTYVLVAVSDTGTGMPAEVIEHAFEPFFTTKGVGKGTGLGLSMVYGLIKQSGGHAKIYSEMGKGTTIKLYLPIPAGTLVTLDNPTKAPTGVQAAATGNILLVEDDDLVRKSLTAKLQRLGYKVQAVNSAAEALAVLEKDSAFELMLSDVMMPGAMTGADLAREVRQRWSKIGVLLNSGYTETSIGGKVSIPEGIRLLSKPYSTADLAAALQETMARAADR